MAILQPISSTENREMRLAPVEAIICTLAFILLAGAIINLARAEGLFLVNTGEEGGMLSD